MTGLELRIEVDNDGLHALSVRHGTISRRGRLGSAIPVVIYTCYMDCRNHAIVLHQV
jgi:hypothetical protein